MKSIVKNAYEDAQVEMKKIIPKSMHISFGRNKKKFLLLLLIPILIELLVLSGAYEMIFG